MIGLWRKFWHGVEWSSFIPPLRAVKYKALILVAHLSMISQNTFYVFSLLPTPCGFILCWYDIRRFPCVWGHLILQRHARDKNIGKCFPGHISLGASLQLDGTSQSCIRSLTDACPKPMLLMLSKILSILSGLFAVLNIKQKLVIWC